MAHQPIVVGQRFNWKRKPDQEEHVATVIAVRNNQQEGLGPQIDDFVGLWVDAVSEDASQHFTIMLGTDGNAYLDGVQIDLQR